MPGSKKNIFYCLRRFVGLVGLISGFAGASVSRGEVVLKSVGDVVLSNRVAEVVVRPDIGRVISFARPGESNCLWVADDPWGYGRIARYGGLRVMIAPEILWKQIRQERRSDPATDGGSWNVLTQTARQVTMQTFSEDLGVEVTWTIFLDEADAELVMDYQIERVKENPFPVHLWSVTQVPLRGSVALSRVSHIPGEYHDFMREPRLEEWMVPVPDSEVFLFYGAQSPLPLKVGTFGRWMAHLNGKEALVIRAPSPEHKPYIDNSNLQVFSSSKKLPFYEIEVTSPMYALRVGESFATREIWALVSLGSDNAVEQAREIESALMETK